MIKVIRLSYYSTRYQLIARIDIFSPILVKQFFTFRLIVGFFAVNYLLLIELNNEWHPNYSICVLHWDKLAIYAKDFSRYGIACFQFRLNSYSLGIGISDDFVLHLII